MVIALHYKDIVLQYHEDTEHYDFLVAQDKNVLSKVDTRFLERTLDGDVPKVDWKKLDREATFKMAQKARLSRSRKSLRTCYRLSGKPC